MRNFKPVLAVLTLAQSLAVAQTAADFATVEKLIQDSLAVVGPNCGILIMRNDSVLYKRYFGTWGDNTYRPIASGSKMASMALIMTEVDAGHLRLDDTVQRYLPSFAGKPIMTLRQLMSHTSGLPDSSEYDGDKSIGSLAEAVDSIGRYTPMSRYAPGTAFIYSGVGMHVAGRMAEIAAGMRWDSLFALKIAGPLGMTHTDYQGLGPTGNFRIGGGMGTTLPDYLRFLNAMLHYGRYPGGRILDSASVLAMQTDQTRGVPLVYTPYIFDPAHVSIRYGFGTWLETVNPRTGVPLEVGSQGAFGFSPWIDRCRNICGAFFVLKTVREIQPTYEALRARIERIVPRTLAQPVVRLEGGRLTSSAGEGNQWLLEGKEIPGATAATFAPAGAGKFSVRVTDKCGCDTVSAEFAFVPAALGKAGIRQQRPQSDGPRFDAAGRERSGGDAGKGRRFRRGPT